MTCKLATNEDHPCWWHEEYLLVERISRAHDKVYKGRLLVCRRNVLDSGILAGSLLPVQVSLQRVYANIVQNSILNICKNDAKTMQRRSENDPKTIRKRSKNDPKTIRSKNDLKPIQKWCENYPKTIRKRSENDPKTIQKRSRLFRKRWKNEHIVTTFFRFSNVYNIY